MRNYVRVRLENGSETTVGREFADMHNLDRVDSPATDSYGRPLPESHPEVAVDDAVLTFDVNSANVAALRGEIDRRNALPGAQEPIAKGRTKAELVAALQADDARLASAGAVPVAGNDTVATTPSGQVVPTGDAGDPSGDDA